MVWNFKGKKNLLRPLAPFLPYFVTRSPLYISPHVKKGHYYILILHFQCFTPKINSFTVLVKAILRGVLDPGPPNCHQQTFRQPANPNPSPQPPCPLLPSNSRASITSTFSSAAFDARAFPWILRLLSSPVLHFLLIPGGLECHLRYLGNAAGCLR